jgi:FkbM family methyltransferase
MKALLKKLIKLSPIPLTQNHRYDLQTKKIMRQILGPESNTIDVGCHKGEVLEWMLQLAPRGQHFGFEPIPDLFVALSDKYLGTPNCHIVEVALSDQIGRTSFNYVTTNPAYSGIRRRRYDREGEKDTQIEVQLNTLDNLIDPQTRIRLIKIDVEGAEWQVLNGAKNLILRDKPYIVFEHGLGASDIYGTKPGHIFSFFEEMGMQLSTLGGFLDRKQVLTSAAFTKLYDTSKEYYFIAWAD